MLLLTAYAMAISSTLCGAVLVENGQRLRESDRFVNQQWLWFNVAAMAQRLCRRRAGAAPVAGCGACTPPRRSSPSRRSAAIFGTLFLIDESPSRLDLAELKSTFRALLAAFNLRELWIVGLFLFFYYLNPGFGTPLYYYMTDSLKFSQAYIGILGAINSAGWIVAALLYRKFFGGMTSKHLLNAEHPVRHRDDGGVSAAVERDVAPRSSTSSAALPGWSRLSRP